VPPRSERDLFQRKEIEEKGWMSKKWTLVQDNWTTDGIIKFRVYRSDARIDDRASDHAARKQWSAVRTLKTSSRHSSFAAILARIPTGAMNWPATSHPNEERQNGATQPVRL
jgi:hypothetical protein